MRLKSGILSILQSWLPLHYYTITEVTVPWKSKQDGSAYIFVTSPEYDDHILLEIVVHTSVKDIEEHIYRVKEYAKYSNRHQCQFQKLKINRFVMKMNQFHIIVKVKKLLLQYLFSTFNTLIFDEIKMYPYKGKDPAT